jgi:hypothetical protein
VALAGYQHDRGVMKDTVEHGRGQDGVAGRFFSPSMRPINVSYASTVSPAPPLGVMPTHPNAKPLIKNRGDYSGTYASVCCCDQRPCKPLASFGQLRWTVSKVFDYSKDAIASEVCNSNTWNVLAFRRSTPVAIAFMKAAVVETLDHGGSFGWREIRDPPRTVSRWPVTAA